MQARRIIALLLVTLIAMPGYGNPAAVGIVQGSTSAMVRGANLVQGTTLYGGDVVEVGSNGNAQIAFSGASQLMVLENSRVQLLASAPKQPVTVNVEQGYAKFRSTAAAPVVAMLGDATVRTANADGVGTVHITNSNSALISAVKGNLLVSTAGSPTVTTVPEGMALTVQMVDDTSVSNGDAQTGGTNQQTAHGGPLPPSKNRKILVGVIIVGAALAIGLAIESGENGNSPSLSPFVP
jgi:hypothetical protein